MTREKLHWQLLAQHSYLSVDSRRTVYDLVNFKRRALSADTYRCKLVPYCAVVQAMLWRQNGIVRQFASLSAEQAVRGDTWASAMAVKIGPQAPNVNAPTNTLKNTATIWAGDGGKKPHSWRNRYLISACSIFLPKIWQITARTSRDLKEYIEEGNWIFKSRPWEIDFGVKVLAFFFVNWHNILEIPQKKILQNVLWGTYPKHPGLSCFLSNFGCHTTQRLKIPKKCPKNTTKIPSNATLPTDSTWYWTSKRYNN